MPKTFLEFIDFAVMWIEDYADEYPDLSLFEYNYDVRNMFIGVIISRYVAYTATTGENLNFDTPLMHKLLNKLDSALPKLKELNPEDENQGFGMGFVTTSAARLPPCSRRAWISPHSSTLGAIISRCCCAG